MGLAISFIKKQNYVFMVLCLSLAIFSPENDFALAGTGLRALSISEDTKITEQDVSVIIKNEKLELDISWQKLRPITFDNTNKTEYINFFDDLIHKWEGYVEEAGKGDSNVINLPDLKSDNGGLIAHFL
ncbi:hypothetical protein [Pseudochrobactrum lubricantis]|uniref:hypothetical protein n=1 Tax=Pseudochrobactrum lubricantis TaxID=558172 RepID=UPI0035D6F1B7